MLPFVGLMLAGEFTSLDEPTDISGVGTIAVFPSDGPISSDLKGVLSPETRRES
jgi:hypothetical protein